MTRVRDTWADSDAPITMELYYSGGWHDITADLSDGGVQITRNPPDPTELNFTLDNEGGVYSPRNPNSPLYGLIGRNTPVQLSVVHNAVTYVRFSGEVSAWPQKWTLKGTAYTPIEAAGVRRRLGQGARPLKAAYRRGCTSPVAPMPDLVAYWPLEDAAGSTSLASGIPGGRPATFTDSPSLASDGESFPCSAPLPVLTTGTMIVAPVSQYAETGEAQVWILVHVPEAGVPSDSRIMLVTCTGTAARWAVVVTPGGDLRVLVEDVNLGVLDDHTWAFDANGRSLRLMLQMEESGTDVVWVLSTLEVGETTGYSTPPQTIGSVDCGQIRQVYIGPDRNLADITVGHLTVQSQITSIYVLDDLLHAYQREEAHARIYRLCGEEGIYASIDGTTSELLGPQGIDTLVGLLEEAADSDQGLLHETRTVLGIRYQTLSSMWSQDPAVTIVYTDNLLLPFEPAEDDRLTRNMVTVIRDGGSSATVEVTEGPMSTQDPPDGVGLYDESVTLSLWNDVACEGQAGWRVNLGTVDEARWPRIGVELAHPVFRADTALTAALLGVDLCDRIVVTTLPDWLPPDDVDQLVVGYTETITPTRYTIVWDCVPASPYRVGHWSDGYRWSPYGVVTAEALDIGETGVDVTNPAGVQWTHADGDYVVRIGGERMTVTAVAGTGTSQTLTVTRSVSKAHAAGAAVVLAEPCHYGRT